VSQPSYTLAWRQDAREAARRLGKTDPDGIVPLVRTISRLAENPRPTGSFAMGPTFVRVHIGFYRVVVEIDEAAHTVVVVHVGRNPAF
jgi:mRNA interferase RelE/StbE